MGKGKWEIVISGTGSYRLVDILLLDGRIYSIYSTSERHLRYIYNIVLSEGIISNTVINNNYLVPGNC